MNHVAQARRNPDALLYFFAVENGVAVRRSPADLYGWSGIFVRLVVGTVDGRFEDNRFCNSDSRDHRRSRSTLGGGNGRNGKGGQSSSAVKADQS